MMITPTNQEPASDPHLTQGKCGTLGFW